MRFLALQTDVKMMKKQFIVEGEEELLCTRHHIFSFLIPMLGVFLLTIVIIAVCATITLMNGLMMLYLTPLVILWALFCSYQMLKALIAWRFNFLIVTTEKIVIVNHTSFFHQEIHPIHIEDIRSSRTQSEFFGIGNCGTLYLHLEEKVEGGNSQQVCISHLPKPAVIVSMIENSVVLKKQRVPVDQGPAEQHQKVEDIKEKAVEAIRKD